MVDKPTLSIFTGDKSLGTVFQEQNQINVKFIDFNLPLSDTTGNTSFNLKGKTRLLMVQCAQDGTGFDGATDNQRIADFVYEMEEWVNANVQTTRIYTDSLGVSYNVYCADFTWTRSFSDPNRILYTLMMKQA